MLLALPFITWDKEPSVGSDGRYGGLSLVGMTAPFEVQACGLVGGDLQCFYSAVSGAGIANVTPLTHAALTLALGKDASSMFLDGTAPPSTSQLASKADALKLALAPLFAQIGGGLDTNVDFTSTPFTADRTGMDKLMDAVKISVGTDIDGNHNTTPFVQMEGKIGSGSTYLGGDGTASGSLGAGSGLSLDLRGIPDVFARLSNAVGASSEEACATAMSASQAFDAAFSLNIDGNGPGIARDRNFVGIGKRTIIDTDDRDGEGGARLNIVIVGNRVTNELGPGLAIAQTHE